MNNEVDTGQSDTENARLLRPQEGYSSGQRGQTVNLLAYAYVGSNPTPSTMAVGVQVAG